MLKRILFSITVLIIVNNAAFAQVPRITSVTLDLHTGASFYLSKGASYKPTVLLGFFAGVSFDPKARNYYTISADVASFRNKIIDSVTFQLMNIMWGYLFKPLKKIPLFIHGRAGMSMYNAHKQHDLGWSLGMDIGYSYPLKRNVINIFAGYHKSIFGSSVNTMNIGVGYQFALRKKNENVGKNDAR